MGKFINSVDLFYIKRMVMGRSIFTYLFMSLFIFSFAAAAVSEQQPVAESCLGESEDLMGALAADGFPVLRVNDTFSKATQVYLAQRLLAQRGASSSFDLVIEYCDDISEVYDLAIESRDALVVLMEFYGLSLTDGMNKSSVDVIITDINEEISSERYERVVPLIERAYDEIGEIQKRETALNSFYNATTRGIKNFFLRAWKSILIGVGVFFLVMFFYGTAIRRYLTKRKVKHLEVRRVALKNYLKKTQRLYFESGKISESEYELRSENFAEMVRDIDRQIPLLNEKLVKYGRKNGKEGRIKRRKK